MVIFHCDACRKSIPAEEVRFVQERGDRVYCRECYRRVPEGGPGRSPRPPWHRWALFVAINLVWLLSIIVITETSGDGGQVLALSTVALVVYAGSLVWVRRSLGS